MGRQLAELAAESDQNGPDGPVFVDETGRRSRRYRRIGVFVGIACAVYAVIIVATLFSGNSSAPWLPINPKDEKPASKVDTPNPPADSLDPSASPGATPSPGASESGTTAPATGDDGKPDPSKTDDGKVEPGDSPDPDPTDDGGKPDPDPTDDGGNPDPTDDPTKPDPDPDPTDDPTTPDPDPPTETPGGAAGGGGEVPAMQPVVDQQSPQRAQSVGYQSPHSADQQPSEGAQR
ncbi:hypothetical protein AB0I94_33145 [Streptomyces sp. NPDC050147]|uniref:hypothetical protein n=1 Tax=Streptomyces sp. NPDC050147 TaxID=3155513 RepID=UPI0034415480